MTVLTAFTVPTREEEHASFQPLPWRRMAWVTWRQHRLALVGAAALMGLVTAYVWIVGVQLHHAYAAAVACQQPNAFACAQLASAFNGKADFLANGFVEHAIPALIGAFLGAPVLARELETGTFRFAWTQGFGRLRWTLAKLSALGVVLAAAAGALGVLFSWYFEPYFATTNSALSLNEASPLSNGLFDVHGITFAAWTLAAFAIGALAGVLIRRVVPAIAVTLAVYAGLAVATGMYLRDHYLTPLVTSRLNLPGSASILGQQWFTSHGQPASESTLDQALQGAGQLAGKGGLPKSLATWQYLVRHGYTMSTTYQPASRFWPFQWIESGWLLVLAVLLIAATLWVVRRRAA